MKKPKIYIEQVKMPNGATRIEVSNQREYDLKHQRNAWWDRAKQHLKKNGIL
jgi:hypothetical protein